MTCRSRIPVTQVDLAPELTPHLLPGKSHQSPSRHPHRPADPRRESTVLFKGFTASTAETGLLEVDEIAEINGSPELMRVSHSGTSVPKLETPGLPGASQSEAAPAFQQAANAAHQQSCNDSQALYTAAPSIGAVEADIAEEDLHASSHEVSSALGPDLEQNPELGAQQAGCSQSHSAATEAGPSLRAVKLQGIQVCAINEQGLFLLSCASVMCAVMCTPGCS